MGKTDYAVAEESGEKLAGENGNGDVKSFSMEEEQGTYRFHVYIDTPFVITLFLSHGRIEFIFGKVQYLYRSASEHDGSHFICHAVLFPMEGYNNHMKDCRHFFSK